MFQSLLKRTEWDNARVGVINENLANLNTPEYMAMDIAKISETRKGALTLTTTHHDHRNSASIGTTFERVKDIEATRLNGHININEQLLKLQEAYMENTLMLNSFKKFIDLHKVVLKR
jgi:flagellar basal body rod protein FlgB